MKKCFSDEQIISILREAEAGVSARELCRKHAISDATFYTWRKKYGGMEVPEVKLTVVPNTVGRSIYPRIAISFSNRLRLLPTQANHFFMNAPMKTGKTLRYDSLVMIWRNLFV